MNYRLLIYKAALFDDWDSVSGIFQDHPNLMTEPINNLNEAPLHMAVGTGHSNRFVEKLVKRIVAVGAKEKLSAKNCNGSHSLHFAAMVGNTTAVRLLVEQAPEMTQVPNWQSHKPLNIAAMYGNEETLRYLLTVTPHLLLPEEVGRAHYTGVEGGDLITFTIMNGLYDVALEIIDMHPNIVLERDKNGQTALEILAQKPEIFPSGSKLGFWGRFIYSLMPVKNSERATQVKILSRISNKFTAGFWRAVQYMAPTIKKIHDMNNQSSLLVDRICKIVIEADDQLAIAWNILGSAMATSVRYGTYELIEKCISSYPGIIWQSIGNFYFFIAAVEQRQERVYNLLYQMSRFKVWTAVQLDSGKKENALHIAAKLAPPHRLNIVTGAALQMQRELQWFQEVENLVLPSYKEALNIDKKTPRMVFTEAHKELLAEGQQWMKDTASSCTVVAALIVTIAFTAVFTVPGGNQDDGKPLFQNKGTFMLFILSDAVALFSSSTSVLMFLGILTSRYAEVDFLYALPKRLTIGLLSLFMSLAATLIAFSSALALVLQGKVAWIAAPLVIATSIPVCLFALLQFPLLVELVKSTYGRSIFHQQNAQLLH